jgi:precorrin-6A synthase
MRNVFVIGMGAGHPAYGTGQAMHARHQVDVFCVLEKGRDTEDRGRLRQESCQRSIPHRSYRIVEARAPQRDRTAAAYQAAVEAWYAQRAALYEPMLAAALGDQDCGAFLVWGDPALYESTLRIIDQLLARGTLAFEYEVRPPRQSRWLDE